MRKVGVAVWGRGTRGKGGGVGVAKEECVTCNSGLGQTRVTLHYPSTGIMKAKRVGSCRLLFHKGEGKTMTAIRPGGKRDMPILV